MFLGLKVSLLSAKMLSQVIKYAVVLWPDRFFRVLGKLTSSNNLLTVLLHAAMAVNSIAFLW